MQHLITPLLAAALLVISTAPVQADLGDQLAKLLPKDGAANDWFGFSVAISGDTAIVGSIDDEDNGDSSGSAYLFDISDPTSPTQIAKLLPDDGAASDEFGYSVAISGTIAIVGARHHDDNGHFSGSAYLFDTSTGRQLAELLSDDGAAGDGFGSSVAISGATAIVGARGDDDNGGGSGSAYVFDATSGQQLFKLLADDGAEGDQFGFSVAVSGTTAIVGAPIDDDSFGSVYLFDTKTGRLITKLLPDDGAGNDWFARSVAISGDTAIVGAPQTPNQGNGLAYLFDITTGRQITRLLADDGAMDDRLGWTVAISGAVAVVGAPTDDDNGNFSGSVYLFDTATGRQIAKLLPDDGATGDQFGVSVASGGAPGKESAIIGAFQDDDNGGSSGSAYLFDAAAPGTCPWDLDDNGIVGAADLLGLLVSWGPCQGCPADFDGNGAVGASDLLALLANWGPCP